MTELDVVPAPMEADGWVVLAEDPCGLEPVPEDWEPEDWPDDWGDLDPDAWLARLPADPWSSDPATDLPPQCRSSEVKRWRERLLAGALPGEQAGLIDLLRELEDLKSAAAAIQARAAVAFEAARLQAEADAGLARSRRGVGIAAEVALARRESPHKGGRLMGLARALVHELPQTLRALGEGTLNEWRATLVVRETAWLKVEDRVALDAWLGTHLGEHPTVGDRRLVAEVLAKVIELDQQAVLRRRAAAARQRRVTLRPLPDGMVQLTAILPLRQGVATYAALREAAQDATAEDSAAHDTPGGEPADSRAARMADALVARVTGRAASDPCGVELLVVITDEALLGVADTPAHVNGYGPMPAGWVRQLIAGITDRAQQVALRRLFRGPGRMVRMETHRRFMGPALRRLIAIRDQQCRTPWCEAPIRQTDHVREHARGGATSVSNGQGLCEACNYTKQAPGWRSTPRQDSVRGHVVTVTTPTGHAYESTQPNGPAD